MAKQGIVIMQALLSIGIGAALGAWLRWWFGMRMNHLFPTLPLSTLTANLLGGFLIGMFIALTRNHAFIPEPARLAIATGFLGGLTTFSTFSAETVTLLTEQEFFWAAMIVLAHVAGSIFATLLGIYVMKLITF